MTLKNITIVISVILIVAIVYYFTMYKSTKENFGDYPISYTKYSTGDKQTLSNTPSFVSVPSFQSMIAPRFQSTPNSSFVRYKPPSYENTAVPVNPLGYSKSVTEAFVGTDQGGNLCSQCKNYGCGSICSQTGMTTASLPTVGINKYSGVSNTSPTPKPIVTDSIPVGSMTSVSETGEHEQTYVVDRLTFASKKSRLTGHGDPIRGDLSITPDEHKGWFQVSVNPKRDLKLGYNQSLAGVQDNTDMAELMLKYGGNASLIGGVSNNNTTTTIGSSGDVSVAVTAFP
jgi:hypothetical protein